MRREGGRKGEREKEIERKVGLSHDCCTNTQCYYPVLIMHSSASTRLLRFSGVLSFENLFLSISIKSYCTYTLPHKVVSTFWFMETPAMQVRRLTG